MSHDHDPSKPSPLKHGPVSLQPQLSGSIVALIVLSRSQGSLPRVPNALVHETATCAFSSAGWMEEDGKKLSFRAFDEPSKEETARQESSRQEPSWHQLSQQSKAWRANNRYHASDQRNVMLNEGHISRELEGGNEIHRLPVNGNVSIGGQENIQTRGLPRETRPWEESWHFWNAVGTF